MPPPPDRTGGAAARHARPFAPFLPGELNELWDVELLEEEQLALDAAIGADPSLRTELAPLLRTLDYDRRELFISALARLLQHGDGRLNIAAGAREALESTRHAAFLLALADQRLGGSR
jgi:hypothetical protein